MQYKYHASSMKAGNDSLSQQTRQVAEISKRCTPSHTDVICVEGGLGQIAKLLVLVRRCACPALLGQVKYSKNVWTGKSREIERVVVRRQQKMGET